MQMLVISSETSSPAYKTLVMVILPVMHIPARRLPAIPGTEPRLRHLNETLFRNLAHARDLIAAWVTDYNTARPHSALGYQTPAGFALDLTTAIARPAARDESSARRAIAQPAPIGVNNHRAPVVAG